MDKDRKVENKFMIAIFLVVIIVLFIGSSIYYYGDEDFWPAVIVTTLMESLMIGLGLLLSKDYLREMISDIFKKAEEQKQNDSEE